jgi:hypothetical protein
VSAIAQIGNDAGWCIEVSNLKLPTRSLRFSRARYDAELTAELNGGGDVDSGVALDGGGFNVVIEGVQEDDARFFAHQPDAIQAKLYLYWRDVPLSLFSPLGEMLGDAPPADSLVAVLKVRSARRRAGERRYELLLECRDWVYDKLDGTIPTQGCSNSPDPLSDLYAMLDEMGVPVANRAAGVAAPSQESSSVSRGLGPRDNGLKQLAQIGRRLEQIRPDRRGLGMFLARDGQLYAGPDRLAPMKQYELSQDNGLIHYERAGSYSDADQASASVAVPTAPRDKVRVLLKGRPDIKPGDFVTLPVIDQPMLDSVLDRAPRAGVYYVQSVRHRLSRTESFSTTLFAVYAESREKAWFANPVAIADAGAAEGAAANAVRRIGRAATTRVLAEVAEVRRTTSIGGADPAQSTLLWRGLVDADGQGGAATRLDIAKQPEKLANTPYATPFAWGKCGLVLPRYPGTRVLVENRDGDRSDPIDIGALWKKGDAPNAQAGDYWLILPVNPQKPDTLGDDEKAPFDVQKATNDIAMADGTRVIEVGKLTISVGDAALSSPGTRPSADTAGDVVIKHAKGSTITIDQDGNITIHSENDLRLEAKGNVVIDAAGVQVNVQNKMDVSKKS